jgi:hypothetical protein
MMLLIDYHISLPKHNEMAIFSAKTIWNKFTPPTPPKKNIVEKRDERERERERERDLA